MQEKPKFKIGDYVTSVHRSILPTSLSGTLEIIHITIPRSPPYLISYTVKILEGVDKNKEFSMVQESLKKAPNTFYLKKALNL